MNMIIFKILNPNIWMTVINNNHQTSNHFNIILLAKLRKLNKILIHYLTIRPLKSNPFNLINHFNYLRTVKRIPKNGKFKKEAN